MTTINIRQWKFPVLLMLSVVVAFGRSDRRQWHTVGGAEVRGRLAEVFGSVILVTGGRKAWFVSLETLTEDELKAVAEFRQKHPEEETWKSSHASVTQALLKKLQIERGGKLVSYDPSGQPEPLVYLLYFSAAWCGPCHRFTPDLVEAYQRWSKEIPGKFEVVFVSDDRSGGEQAEYAREFHMPWPMLNYGELAYTNEVTRWEGSGIPCLVAITRDGYLIFHSYDGKEYLGADSVVEKFDRLVPVLRSETPSVRHACHHLAVVQYLETIGAGSARPKPYLVALDPTKYGEISVPHVEVTLELDTWGDVKTARFTSEVPPEISDLIMSDVRQWQFLPAVEQGKPQAATVRVPFAIGQKPATLAKAHD